jgi:hypothetical protein
MDIKAMLEEIDTQIGRLQGARRLLSGLDEGKVAKVRKKMSASARRKIAAAQRARWAKLKKSK